MTRSHGVIPARLVFALIGVLLFNVSGGALLAHMAVAHDDAPGHATGDTPRPYDHARDCDLGHLLHGLTASLAPPAVGLAPAPSTAIAAAAPERPPVVLDRATRRTRAPPSLHV